MLKVDERLDNKAWDGFKGGDWQTEIDVRDFIQNNFTQYNGDQSFLEGPTEATTKLNDQLVDLKLKERQYLFEIDIISSILQT